MAATKQTAIDSCYAGLTCFASPIIHQKDVVGAFSGGMVIRKSDTASNPLAHTRFDVTELDEETINRIANLLDATLALLQDDRTPQDRLGDERESELVHDFGLTSREIMITDQIVRNRSNLEIAEVLFISEKTVKTHISNILKNTRVKNRYELAAICKSYFDN